MTGWVPGSRSSRRASSTCGAGAGRRPARAARRARRPRRRRRRSPRKLRRRLPSRSSDSGRRARRGVGPLELRGAARREGWWPTIQVDEADQDRRQVGDHRTVERSVATDAEQREHAEAVDRHPPRRRARSPMPAKRAARKPGCRGSAAACRWCRRSGAHSTTRPGVSADDQLGHRRHRRETLVHRGRGQVAGAETGEAGDDPDERPRGRGPPRRRCRPSPLWPDRMIMRA